MTHSFFCEGDTQKVGVPENQNIQNGYFHKGLKENIKGELYAIFGKETIFIRWMDLGCQTFHLGKYPIND